MASIPSGEVSVSPVLRLRHREFPPSEPNFPEEIFLRTCAERPSASAPQEFTADVFYELYKAKTDSNNMSPIDVGSLIINYTLHENPGQAGML